MFRINQDNIGSYIYDYIYDLLFQYCFENEFLCDALKAYMVNREHLEEAANKALNQGKVVKSSKVAQLTIKHFFATFQHFLRRTKTIPFCTKK